MALGKIFACDPGAKAVDVLDLTNQTFERLPRHGSAGVANPLGCAADPTDGSLYIADANSRRIIVLDSMGAFLTSLGEGVDMRPSAVFVTGDSVFVADLDGQRVAIFGKRSGSLIGFVPDAPTTDEERLFSPVGVAVSDQAIYVSDFGAFQIKVYDRSGSFLRTIGSYGRGFGQFIRPKGIAVDREDNLYVVDAGFENVQIFDKDGQILMYFGGPYAGPGDMYMPAGVAIDYQNLRFFERFVDPKFDLKHVILVANQYGPDKITVYGFVGPTDDDSFDASSQ
jgi:DNA-binding beta-propeller fold protein YncE